ncbi:hypothetical protein [Pararhizobium gei]|uniref:hypothetical protein n=1 Tax=Pararhizobium gei TaxID=1395951 RepID=UPI0023DAAE9A|nr:hypothetical protein [Rhizobium gei]
MSLNQCKSLLPMLIVPPEHFGTDGPASPVILDVGSPQSFADHDAVRNILLRRKTLGVATYLRVRLGDDAPFQDWLTRMAGLRPAGFVLAGCGGGADIQKLDVMLRVGEVESGTIEGSLGILAETGETPSFFLAPSSLRNLSRRLEGIILDARALAQTTASDMHNDAAGRPGAPLLFARATVILRAADAGVACYEILGEDLATVDALQTAQAASRADGFSNFIVRDAAQLSMLAAG